MQLAQVARDEHISSGYLEQIVRALKPLGVLRAVRGAGGGYSLAKKPAEINMEDVFTHLEGGVAPVRCLGNENHCKRSEICTSRNFWEALDRHTRDFLRRVSLEDILRQDCQEFFAKHS